MTHRPGVIHRPGAASVARRARVSFLLSIYVRPSAADLARIEAVDWLHMAKEFIIQVLEN
jgi:hypothetical protein